MLVLKLELEYIERSGWRMARHEQTGDLFPGLVGNIPVTHRVGTIHGMIVFVVDYTNQEETTFEMRIFRAVGKRNLCYQQNVYCSSTRSISSSGRCCPDVSAKLMPVLRHSACCCHRSKRICDVFLPSLSWLSSASLLVTY